MSDDVGMLLARIDALQALLVCYRTGGRPTEKLHKQLERTKADEQMIRGGPLMGALDAGTELHYENFDDCQELCRRHGLDPKRVRRVEDDVVDIPLLRFHVLDVDEEGNQYVVPGTGRAVEHTEEHALVGELPKLVAAVSIEPDYEDPFFWPLALFAAAVVIVVLYFGLVRDSGGGPPTFEDRCSQAGGFVATHFHGKSSDDYCLREGKVIDP